MSSKKITLKGFITVPVDRLEHVRSALPQHILLTREEPGCLFFDVTENATIIGQFDVYEEFSNRASFEAHQQRGARSNWAHVTKGIARQYTISEDS